MWKVVVCILYEEVDLFEDKVCYVFLYFIVGFIFFCRIYILIFVVIDWFVYFVLLKWVILNIVSCYGEFCRVGKGVEGLYEVGVMVGFVCILLSFMLKLGYVMVNIIMLYFFFFIWELFFVLLDKLWFFSLGFRVVDFRVVLSFISGMKLGNRVED